MTEKCRLFLLLLLPPPQKKNVTIIMGKEGENRGRRSSMKKNPKIPLFGHILIYLPNLLFGAYLLLLVHIQYTPSEGPKGFKMCFFRNYDRGKRPSNMGQLCGP